MFADYEQKDWKGLCAQMKKEWRDSDIMQIQRTRGWLEQIKTKGCPDMDGVKSYC